MSKGLQWLVGLTCLVVIALGGYWFFNDQSARAAQSERAAFAAKRAECLELAASPLGKRVRREWSVTLEGCFLAGLLTEADSKRILDEARGK